MADANGDMLERLAQYRRNAQDAKMMWVTSRSDGMASSSLFPVESRACFACCALGRQVCSVSMDINETTIEHARSLSGLLDKSDIADVIHAYCFHFDRAETESVLALFTEDAVVDYGPDVPTLVGLEEIAPMISRGLAEFFAATSHHVSNITVAFDTPDQATSVCYLYAWHRYQDGRPNSELWGQYHHAFRRVGAAWKISNLVLRAAGSDQFHRDMMHPIGRR